MLLRESKSNTKGPQATWREAMAAKTGLSKMLADQTAKQPRPGHAGGDTRAAHAGHVKRLGDELAGMATRKEKLPSQSRHPKEPDYAEMAGRIGANVSSFREGSELRRMVDAALPRLGVAPMVRKDDGKITLEQVLETEISVLCRERLVEGAPAADEINAMKRAVWVAARSMNGDLSLPADAALDSLRTAIGTGKIKLPRVEAAAFERIEASFAKLRDGNGLPEEFPERLTAFIARAGLTFPVAARMVGMNPQTLTNWARGRKVPDKSKWHFVTALEELCRASGELTCCIRTKRKGRARFAQTLYPEHLRGIAHVRRRSEISPLLPADFETLSEEVRFAAVVRAEAKLEHEHAARRQRGKRLTKDMRYGLAEFPKAFGDDYDAMAKFRESIAGSGKLTGKQWTGKTSEIWATRVLPLCGYVTSKHAGPHRIALERLDFVKLFLDPTKIDAFIGFKLDRAKMAGASTKPTDVDIEYYNFAAAMFSEKGWLRQSPEFARRAGIAKAKWQQKCDDVEAAYRKLASDRRKNRRKHSYERKGSRDDSYGGALAVLKLKRPMDPVFRLVASMQAEFDQLSDMSAKKAGASEDLVFVQLQAQLALRPFTWSKFLWRPDNTGYLRKDADGWFVDIPRECFKNRDSRALDEGFMHRIRDVDGLYANLEAYLAVHRFVIVRGMKTDLLFVYGRKGLKADGTPLPSKRRNNRPFEAGLAAMVRRCVARHIGYEAPPEPRVPGLRTFSPCAFRHILATSIVKATGRCDLAADAIGDTEEIACKYYQRFLPSDRKESLEAARSSVFTGTNVTPAAAPERRKGTRYRPGDARCAAVGRRTRARLAAGKRGRTA